MTLHPYLTGQSGPTIVTQAPACFSRRQLALLRGGKRHSRVYQAHGVCAWPASLYRGADEAAVTRASLGSEGQQIVALWPLPQSP